MGKLKIFIYLAFFLIAGKLIAQPVDTISFRFIRDVSTYKVRCLAQKVSISTPDTTYSDFELSDTAGGAYTFTWGGDQIPTPNNLPFARYEFSAEGIFTFTVSVFENATGLTYTDTKTYNIRDIIRIPNVFTPGDDGINDRFIVNSNGLVNNPLEISIYSRTGSLVYHTKSPIIVWDGRNTSGQFVSKGVYFYVLTSDDPTVEPIKGFFHVYYHNDDVD